MNVSWVRCDYPNLKGDYSSNLQHKDSGQSLLNSLTTRGQGCIIQTFKELILKSAVCRNCTVLLL